MKTGTKDGLLSDEDNSFDEDDETTPLNAAYASRRNSQDNKGWDVFVVTPNAEEDETISSKWVDITLKVLKVVTYFITFALVLSSAAVSKATLLFIVSHIAKRTVPVCRNGLAVERDKDHEATISDIEKIAWLWVLFFILIIPELFTLFRSSRICVFKSYRRPNKSTFFTVFLMETLHTVGLCMLVFVVLPDLDVVKGAMLTNCVCFVPGFFSMLSHYKGESKRFAKLILDALSLLAQATGFVIWPWVVTGPRTWTVPIAVFLTSFRWWENYVDRRSPIGFVSRLAEMKDDLRKSRYFTYIFVSCWKILVILCCMLGFMTLTQENVLTIFRNFASGFHAHKINVVQVRRQTLGDLPDLPTASPLDDDVTIVASEWTPIFVAAIQVLSSLLCYVSAKFACKICIQGFSFAFPVSLTIPVSISLLIAACGMRTEDVCFFESYVPKYLFWRCPAGEFFQEFITTQHAWIWLAWLLSQTWIAVHIWMPKCERLATTEKLFVNPMYCGALIDQSLALNRRRDDEGEIKSDELALDAHDDNDISQYYETISIQTESSSNQNGRTASCAKTADHIIRIYACATMWHETAEEMIQMLKSVIRMDEDQSARRNAQKYLRIVDPDYYEFEVHVFFDDAFELSDDNDEEMVVNRFVKQMVRVIDTAASNVHQCNIRLKPPKKLPTPYGGRLVWQMPGKNKLIAHLKDKGKIRHRKRWSQVMYMYYLLGHKLMELPIDVSRKAVMAENTFILALDGDINFRPHAVQLLVDLMKKNRGLGAACGRIHPVGTGPMVWYQKFEYAIGHWLQKATEHMIGCVLCSPGCFSLFRAKALMDDNVMRRYTTRSDEALHYVQYDQGEDRWLCTLLLQRGYRVEYSAASDAYTHCPEGFGEFYTQRRRWAPSTMANIMDLLGDYKRTVAINDNISFPYIIYQGMLMVGTILGPGTIFLMLVGAMVAAFKISNWISFSYNIVPILLFMLICFTTKNEIQIIVAQIMSASYALLMMAVLVGTAIQVSEDGVGSPSAIFLISLSSSFFVAALMHPQEFMCIIPGLLYFLSVPSMYLLLILYSLINLNVVTWGTREVQTKKTKKEMEEERKLEEEMKKKKKKGGLLGLLDLSGKGSDEGMFGLQGLFTCMICSNPNNREEKVHLARISDQLDNLSKKISSMERQLEIVHGVPPPRRKPAAHGRSSRQSDGGLSVLNEDVEDDGNEYGSDTCGSLSEQLEPRQERDDLINPYWIEDKELKRGEVEYLPGPEIQFWKDLIEKYLYPIDENKEEQARIAADLKELRNRVVFAFFMLNALFILIVFLLQLNKKQLHVNWPLGVKTNITFIPDTSQVVIEKEHLQLEPIGLIFVIFFAVIMVIQFTGMLFHRFETLSHILASIELSCCHQKVEDVSDDAFIDRNAIQIARQLQRLKGIDEDDDNSDEYLGPERLERRKTIQNLEKRRHQRARTGTLDVAFRKRFMSINAVDAEAHAGTPVLSGLRRFSRNRDTLRALEVRRNTVLANHSKMQTLGAKNQYSAAAAAVAGSGGPPGVRTRHRNNNVPADRVFSGANGEGYTNDAYETTQPDEDTSAAARQSLRLQVYNDRRSSVASYADDSESGVRKPRHSHM
nr:chitin synthase chs-2-like [Rhipicephalus microplus]